MPKNNKALHNALTITILSLFCLIPAKGRVTAAETASLMNAARPAKLIKELGSSNPKVRLKAIQQLGQYGRLALADLIIALGDENQLVRAGAALALKEMRGAASMATSDLVKALKDPEPPVRMAAADALAWTDPDIKTVSLPLENALYDPSPVVANLAAVAFGRLKIVTTSGTKALTTVMLAKDNSQAAWALGEIGSKDQTALPALIKAIHHRSDSVQKAAIRALGNIGEGAKSSTPDLREMLNHGSPSLHAVVRRALIKIDPSFKQELQDLKSKEEETSERRTEEPPPMLPALPILRNTKSPEQHK